MSLQKLKQEAQKLIVFNTVASRMGEGQERAHIWPLVLMGCQSQM